MSVLADGVWDILASSFNRGGGGYLGSSFSRGGAGYFGRHC